jgi:hypothetical protein
MAHHKKHAPAPVPPGNRPAGPQGDLNTGNPAKSGKGEGAPFQEHDPKNRLGDFESEGEHSRQQPTALNDGHQHSR